MINKTIAFSNSGSFWKTRYSFISSCFAFLDKLFFSSPTKANNGEICWEHNKNNAPKNTFYGGIPISSSISVTFNQNPSSNKVYKSFSLEGTSNISGLNSIIVNNSSDDTQRKNATISLLEEKGGILYGNVGQIQKVTGTNVKAVGQISAVSVATGGNYIPSSDSSELLRIFLSSSVGVNIPTSKNAKFFVTIAPKVSSTVGTQTVYFNEPAGPSEIELFYKSGNAYSPLLANSVVQETIQDVEVTVNAAQDILLNNNNLTQDVPFENILTLGDLYNSNFLLIPSDEGEIGFVATDNQSLYIEFDENNNTHSPTFGTVQAGAEDYLLHTPIPLEVSYADYDMDTQAGIDAYNEANSATNDFYNNNLVTLYAITPSSTSGDDPKGQYADAVVTLGNENFELYALNLEYEGTQYDHSLQLRKRAQQTQGQPRTSSRRRKR